MQEVLAPPGDYEMLLPSMLFVCAVVETAVNLESADAQLLHHSKSAGSEPKAILFPRLAEAMLKFGRERLRKDDHHKACLEFDSGYLLTAAARRMLKGKLYEPLAFASAPGPDCPSEVGLWDPEAPQGSQPKRRKTVYVDYGDVD